MRGFLYEFLKDGFAAISGHIIRQNYRKDAIDISTYCRWFQKFREGGMICEVQANRVHHSFIGKEDTYNTTKNVSNIMTTIKNRLEALGFSRKLDNGLPH